MDSVMLRARELFDQSNKTLAGLGQAMGYKGKAARKSAWQFLHKTNDPRLSMLRRFARALHIPITDLIRSEEPCLPKPAESSPAG